MNIEAIFTKAWQQQSAWLWLLLPISWLYGGIVWLRRLSYRLGWQTRYQAPVPVMVVGNITIGGSGKTPLIISLVEYLQQRGVKVAVISRGYGGNEAIMPALVNAQSIPSQVGDEPCMIAAQTGAPMAVCPNRQLAIETLLIEHPNIDLIIADDGLQHYRLARDIEWIVVDEARGFGNRQLLPVGYLREPISRLQRSTVIWHQSLAAAKSASDQPTKLTMHLQSEQMQPLIHLEGLGEKDTLPTALLESCQRVLPPKQGQRVHAISGIGYPKRFFDTLRGLGFEVIEHPFPDHYAFTWSDLLPFNEHPIVMTSKDAVKFRALISQLIEALRVEQAWVSGQATIALKEAQTVSKEIEQIAKCLGRVWVLPVQASLSASCYDVLEKQLTTLNVHFTSV